MAEQYNSGILLESGTNEIEIMEFTIDGSLYGINVAKVREIIMSAPVKIMPHAHPAVEGIFKPRDVVITVVDLPKYLSVDKEKGSKDLFIITNFNKMYIAFRVHTVVGISRISWTDIHKPDKTVSGGSEGVATGIAQCGNDLVTILDFERIVAEIAPETTIQMDEIEQMGPRARSDEPIWIAEDSILLSKMIEDCLHKAGYVNLRMFPNGQELWEALNALPKERRLFDQVALVITDIEMPQMDGHRLTKLIKDSPRFNPIPLIIFSSLISEEMRIKGRQLGANEQMSKPEIGHLVDVMDHLLAEIKQ
ncbi:MAG: chemotaxis protein [Lawsonibacter sp.]|jgi:two-component system chemotaxis response regulator CheV|nr:chemotaxis protein CheV [Lawsonibacter sp.]MCI9026523.1 chemotaxis protein CheV [Lawsonibacter sp.]MCI9294216.1 chemotaxis protein CheV [Lawsonibacter sp.]MCI9655872.1 chemotaxis protein CheV [Lawsonibacter sp.]MDE6897830.1 chemotaxis protein [Lawsonibacter sp.]